MDAFKKSGVNGRSWPGVGSYEGARHESELDSGRSRPGSYVLARRKAQIRLVPRTGPRRSPKVTHLCSDRVAHTKNSVSRSFGRVGGIGGRDSDIIRAAFLARGKTIVFIKMRVAVAICPRAARSEPEIGTLHQLPT